MSTEERTGVSRRRFLGAGSALLAGGILGSLTGCNSSQVQVDQKPSEAHAVDRELDCDIIVIGAGGSGLPASIEAAEAGLKVICVESQAQVGGNAVIAEGCFAVDSSLQQAEGIVVDTGEIIRSEQEQGQYRVSGGGYIDLVKNSGSNIDWLLEHGVQFMRVDSDHGTMPLFHRYAESKGSVGYVTPMSQAMQDAGVETLLNTHADEIIHAEDGSIQGIYATNTDDGTGLRINAPVVIVATGGFRENDEYMKLIGFDPEYTESLGFPGHDGHGHDMAIACGAADNMMNAATIGNTYVWGLLTYFEGGVINAGFVQNYPQSLWFNEHGERFLNEDFARQNMMLSQVPMRGHRWAFVFVNEALMEAYLSNTSDVTVSVWDSSSGPGAEIQKGLDMGLIFKADSLEELAKETEMDPEILKESIKRYNESVALGSDRDYGKKSEFLVALDNGPYYAAKITAAPNVTLGSIKTNRDFNAIDINGEAIKGLYVVGVEGAMLWANVYTVNISGGCVANNVNSGLTAARHAIANCF